MKSKIDYEWCFETWDEHDDIVDHLFCEKLKEARFQVSDLNDNFKLVLVYNKYSQELGLEDRLWCYTEVKDGSLILPDNFRCAFDKPSRKCPKRFNNELNKWMQT